MMLFMKPARILTPEYIATLYTALKQIPPFDVYPMPTASNIKFVIIKNPGVHGYFVIRASGELSIEISSGCNFLFDTILSSLLHEMTHMALYVVGDKGYGRHGKSFNKIRDAYASMYNLDPRSI